MLYVIYVAIISISSNQNTSNCFIVVLFRPVWHELRNTVYGVVCNRIFTIWFENPYLNLNTLTCPQVLNPDMNDKSI